jgi:lysophospholipase L1-like esterase
MSTPIAFAAMYNRAAQLLGEPQYIVPSGPYLAWDGDSRIATNFSAGGTRHELRSLRYWLGLLANQRLVSNYSINFGVSGETSAQILARAATTAAASAQAVVGLFSTNDRGSLTAAQSLSNITAWVAAMRAANKVVFICDETPRTDLAGALLTEHLAVRDGIRAMAAPGVFVLPTWNSIASAGDNQVADAAKLYDNVHPNPIGGAAMAAACLPIIKACYADPNTLSLGTNLATNPTQTGTTGTVTAPATGQTATSWTGNVRADLAPATAAFSKVSEGGKTWQRILVTGTPTTGAIPEVRYFHEPSVAGFAAGDVVELLARVKITNVGNMRHIILQLLYGNSLASDVSDGFGTTALDFDGGPWEGIMRTPPATIPALNNQMRINIAVRGIQNEAMDADVEFTDIVLRKIT